jgi:hypothetical protein
MTATEGRRSRSDPAALEVTRRFLAASGPVTREDLKLSARTRHAAEREAERLAGYFPGTTLDLSWTPPS